MRYNSTTALRLSLGNTVRPSAMANEGQAEWLKTCKDICQMFDTTGMWPPLSDPIHGRFVAGVRRIFIRAKSEEIDFSRSKLSREAYEMLRSRNFPNNVSGPKAKNASLVDEARMRLQKGEKLSPKLLAKLRKRCRNGNIGAATRQELEGLGMIF